MELFFPDVILLKAALKRLIVTRDDTMLLMMNLTKNSNCSSPPAIVSIPGEEDFIEDDEAFHLGEFLIIDSLNVDNSDVFKRLKLDTLAYISEYAVTHLCKIEKTVKNQLYITSLLSNDSGILWTTSIVNLLKLRILLMQLVED